MAWHPLTRLLVVLGPLAIGVSYLLEPDDPAAVPAVVRSGNAQAALPPEAPAAEPPPALLAPQLSDLTATVERPLFNPSRRGPQPPPPPAEAPPPPPPPPNRRPRSRCRA
ncbi:hypothetical protein [Inquilinus sp. Marseille-Q2685]|uniref:hypothetical protein n=1 Tax=Inquilinus sp. Marseille-Q2685 TaxID=2866581 RepID=UPI001CE3C371|nr:hypothetical protein [Inquilinus sp. Marseille-Q2685]